MSNNDFFGGKLKKILASMCSFVVGASGVSQAEKPGTSMPTELKLGKDARLFGFGDFGWKLESGAAKKGNSWLVSKNKEGKYDMRYQNFGKDGKVWFSAGFSPGDCSCDFDIWVNGKPTVWVSIPKGILFDVMRHFELNYFLDDGDPRDKGTELSCANKSVNKSAVDEVFLRFILWAFCGANKVIDSAYSSEVNELKDGIFELAVKKYDFNNAEGNFVEKTVEVTKDEKNTEEKKYYVLKPGYFLENFNKRVREVYRDLGYDVTDIDNMGKLIIHLNKEKNQKHIGKYLLGALGSFAVGGILTEGAHRFLGAKRSGSSEVNKGKPPIDKVNKGKPSSNKKGGQKAKKNLKKQRG